MDYSRAKLDLYAALANIGAEYASGRMGRQAFIDAAVTLGLKPDQAEGRALAYDAHPFPVAT
jgi:hypothetical protein